MLRIVANFLMASLLKGWRVLQSSTSAAIYASICIVTFTLIYWLMGLSKHFDVPEYLKGNENSFLNCLYTSVLAQSNAMPDTTPKTNIARVLFMTQVSLGWMWFLFFASGMADA